LSSPCENTQEAGEREVSEHVDHVTDEISEDGHTLIAKTSAIMCCAL